MPGLLERAESELHARHAFFVDWFTGKETGDRMSECTRAFAADMQRIGPEGTIQDTADIIGMIRSAMGKRPDDFAIWVTMQTARLVAPDMALLIYDEHQRIDGTETRRRSTALFTADPDAPEGVVWRHLQETWIAP